MHLAMWPTLCMIGQVHLLVFDKGASWPQLISKFWSHVFVTMLLLIDLALFYVPGVFV